MAANMKAVKLRIKSVENTMQITKAMELVAYPNCAEPKNVRTIAVLTLKNCTIHLRL